MQNTYSVLMYICTEILYNCYYSLSIIFSAPQFLIPVLSENFPYMKKPTVFQVILKKFFLLSFLLTAVFTGFSEKSIFHVIQFLCWISLSFCRPVI